jgi:hypothetical protein
MSAGDLTLLDLRNILEWYELISNKKYSSEEQHVRTKIKIQGFIVAMEDSSEPLADNLIKTILSGLDSANYTDLQYPRSLLANRIIRINEYLKSLSTLMNTVDEKIGETKQ